MKESKGYRIFMILNTIFMVLLSIIMIYPIWDVVRISLCTPAEASRMVFSLWPSEISLEAYNSVWNNQYIWSGYMNTIIRIIVGMIIQMTLVILIAYPLSRKDLPHRKFWTFLIIFTMFFRGGLIPDYLLINALGMRNTMWSLVLPRAVNTFAMLILRNYFMTLPQSLQEAAKVDGASELATLVKIILPLCKPILVTVFMWGTVWYWNEWFHCILYISDNSKFVLQAVLRKIVIDASADFSEIGGKTAILVNGQVIKAAAIVVSTLPILVLYPFMQKHFVQGMVIGAVKG